VHNLKQIPVVETGIPVRIEVLKKEDIQRINSVKKLDVNRLLIRLERGDICYVSIKRDDDKILSYHWVQKEGSHFIQQANKFVTMKKHEACIYHVRVVDEVKGNRINGAVYAEILKKSKDESLNKVWVYTNYYNRANRKGLEYLGFKIEYKIYSIFFNKKFYQIFKKIL
jgi:hypothetical protein